MEMFQNILFQGFKGEQPGPTYYLSPENIYGFCIHDASNKNCYVYIWIEFEGKKGMKKIPVPSLFGSMTKVTIPNYTVRTIIYLKLLFLLTNVVVRTRIM